MGGTAGGFTALSTTEELTAREKGKGNSQSSWDTGNHFLAPSPQDPQTYN